MTSRGKPPELDDTKAEAARSEATSIRRTCRKGAFFAFLAGLTYDLEPLAAGAGCHKSGGGSFRGDKHKAYLAERRVLCLFGRFILGISSFFNVAMPYLSTQSYISKKAWRCMD